MKKIISLLISFLIMFSIVGCSKLDIGEEFKSDMTDVFDAIYQKQDYFNKGEYAKWLSDTDMFHYIYFKITKYDKEILTKDEDYILQAIEGLHESYMKLQSKYSEYGDKTLNDGDFKESIKEFESDLKEIKSKIK